MDVQVAPASASEALSRPGEAPAAETLTFPTVGTGGAAWTLTGAQVAEWQRLFPGVSVRGECQKALAWIVSHPARRKTAKGMAGFLVGWLNRATDRGTGPAVESRGARIQSSGERVREAIRRGEL